MKVIQQHHSFSQYRPLTNHSFRTALLCVSIFVSLGLNLLSSPQANAGSYFTVSDLSETIGGGFNGPGFSSIEEAGLWGWENAKSLRSRPSTTGYGGLVYFQHSNTQSPPESGWTNYWWGAYYKHNELYPIYAIGYSIDTPTVVSILKQPPNICVGNPIVVATGNKFQTEVDYQSQRPFGLSFTRVYNSTAYSVDTGIGTKWRHGYARRVAATGTNTLVYRSNGQAFVFNYDGNEWIGDVDISDTLVEVLDDAGNRTGWHYTDNNDTVESYNNAGQLIKLTNRTGQSQDFFYDLTLTEGGDDNSQTLDKVTGFSGEVMSFIYDSAQRITVMTDSSGNQYFYDYDALGNLISVTYPDNTAQDELDNPQRLYHYDNPNFPHHLTGRTDEAGSRVTWDFDEQGRAISSELDGGVDKFSLVFHDDDSVTTTNPLGKDTTYHFTTLHGVKKVVRVEGHEAPNCVAANQHYRYDDNGYLKSKTDWQGNVTSYVHNERGLEISRTQSAGTADAKTTITQWHPHFRLPLQISEPGKIMTYHYDKLGRQLSKTITAP